MNQIDYEVSVWYLQ